MSAKKLGETLVEAGLITNRQLMEALKDQKVFGGRLGSILLEKCVITESVYLTTLSKMLNFPVIDLEDRKLYESVIKSIPMESAWNHMMIPVEMKKDNGGMSLLLAMADPTDAAAIAEARTVTGNKILPALSTESVIRHILMDYYQNQYGSGDYTLQKRVVPKCEDSGKANMEVSDSRTSKGASDVSFIVARTDVLKTTLDNETSRAEAGVEFKQAIVEDMMLEKIARIQHEIDALLRLMSKKGVINPKEYMETLREVKADGLLKM